MRMRWDFDYVTIKDTFNFRISEDRAIWEAPGALK